MSDRDSQLQALLAELDVAAQTGVASSALLASARDYLAQLAERSPDPVWIQQSWDDLNPDMQAFGLDQPEPSSAQASPLEPDVGAGPGRALVATIEADLQSLRQRLLEPLQGDIERLRLERQSLEQEIAQLEGQRQYYQSLAQQQANQEQVIADFLQQVGDRLQTNLSDRALAEGLTVVPETRLNALQVDANSVLERARATLEALAGVLQTNARQYEESLAGVLERMHVLGEESEAILDHWLGRLAATAEAGEPGLATAESDPLAQPSLSTEPIEPGPEPAAQPEPMLWAGQSFGQDADQQAFAAGSQGDRLPGSIGLGVVGGLGIAAVGSALIDSGSDLPTDLGQDLALDLPTGPPTGLPTELPLPYPGFEPPQLLQNVPSDRAADLATARDQGLDSLESLAALEPPDLADLDEYDQAALEQETVAQEALPDPAQTDLADDDERTIIQFAAPPGLGVSQQQAWDQSGLTAGWGRDLQAVHPNNADDDDERTVIQFALPSPAPEPIAPGSADLPSPSGGDVARPDLATTDVATAAGVGYEDDDDRTVIQFAVPPPTPPALDEENIFGEPIGLFDLPPEPPVQADTATTALEPDLEPALLEPGQTEPTTAPIAAPSGLAGLGLAAAGGAVAALGLAAIGQTETESKTESKTESETPEPTEAPDDSTESLETAENLDSGFDTGFGWTGSLEPSPQAIEAALAESLSTDRAWAEARLQEASDMAASHDLEGLSESEVIAFAEAQDASELAGPVSAIELDLLDSGLANLNVPIAPSPAPAATPDASEDSSPSTPTVGLDTGFGLDDLTDDITEDLTSDWDDAGLSLEDPPIHSTNFEVDDLDLERDRLNATPEASLPGINDAALNAGVTAAIPVGLGLAADIPDDPGLPLDPGLLSAFDPGLDEDTLAGAIAFEAAWDEPTGTPETIISFDEPLDDNEFTETETTHPDETQEVGTDPTTDDDEITTIRGSLGFSQAPLNLDDLTVNPVGDSLDEPEPDAGFAPEVVPEVTREFASEFTSEALAEDADHWESLDLGSASPSTLDDAIADEPLVDEPIDSTTIDSTDTEPNGLDGLADLGLGAGLAAGVVAGAAWLGGAIGTDPTSTDEPIAEAVSLPLDDLALGDLDLGESAHEIGAAEDLVLEDLTQADDLNLTSTPADRFEAGFEAGVADPVAAASAPIGDESADLVLDEWGEVTGLVDDRDFDLSLAGDDRAGDNDLNLDSNLDVGDLTTEAQSADDLGFADLASDDASSHDLGLGDLSTEAGADDNLGLGDLRAESSTDDDLGLADLTDEASSTDDFGFADLATEDASADDLGLGDLSNESGGQDDLGFADLAAEDASGDDLGFADSAAEDASADDLGLGDLSAEVGADDNLGLTDLAADDDLGFAEDASGDDLGFADLTDEASSADDLAFADLAADDASADDLGFADLAAEDASADDLGFADLAADDASADDLGLGDLSGESGGQNDLAFADLTADDSSGDDLGFADLAAEDSSEDDLDLGDLSAESGTDDDLGLAGLGVDDMSGDDLGFADLAIDEANLSTDPLADEAAFAALQDEEFPGLGELDDLGTDLAAGLAADEAQWATLTAESNDSPPIAHSLSDVLGAGQAGGFATHDPFPLEDLSSGDLGLLDPNAPTAGLMDLGMDLGSDLLDQGSEVDLGDLGGLAAGDLDLGTATEGSGLDLNLATLGDLDPELEAAIELDPSLFADLAAELNETEPSPLSALEPDLDAFLADALMSDAEDTEERKE